MASTLQRYAHPALFVDELIFEFLQHLHRSKSSIDKADINAAGLTCKAWRDPALAVRWQEADLKSLLSVLAPLRASDPEDQPSVWSFAHVPKDRDHHRFHDIASRVHFLSFGGYSRFEESVFATISNGLPAESTVLLPNLRSARFAGDGRFVRRFTEKVTRLLPFCPPSLRQLTLSLLPGLPRSRETLLRSLTSRFSRLSTIDFHRAACVQADVGPMVELLEHNPDLRHVTIKQTVLSVTVDALSKLPHLESLDIKSDALNEPLDYWTYPPGGPFPQLKSLTLQLPLDAGVFDLVANIGAHHSLQTLSMVSPYIHPIQLDLGAAVDAVVKHRQLRNLSFRQLLFPTSQVKALQAISACTTLESLEINIMMTSDTPVMSTANTSIADKVVGDLLQHLPHLTELTLSFKDSNSSEPLLTFRALAMAVVHCPLLACAALVIDTRVPIALAPVSKHNERRRILDFSFTASGVDDSPIDDPKHVADVLTQLCPDVDIRMKKDLYGRYRWGDVAKILSRSHDVPDTEVRNELRPVTDASLAVTESIQEISK
ncbi:hypothetical protein FRB93_004871 [Tulasnella sp. JGI-2019a]|nr:hypothetical protein FRB93_004871 [Tulasnella sp. JGI-2019a]